MKDQQLQLIREKCIEANPEIVELKFGCVVKYSSKINMTCFHYGVDTSEYGNGNVGWYFIKEDGGRYFDSMPNFPIIGRPIRLSDVLLAMKAKIYHSFVDMDGIIWNLKQDDLTLQSPECIEFIYSLLSVSNK